MKAILLLLSMVFALNAHADQSIKGNVTVEKQLNAYNVNAPNKASTSSFSGVSINNTQIGTTGTDNISIRAGASGDKVVTIYGDLNPNGSLVYAPSNDSTTTGANATVAGFTTKYIRFINASLTSIDMIPAPAGTGTREISLFNNVGHDIVFNLNTGATAANRIIAPTGSTYKLKDGHKVDLAYNYTSLRWVIGSAAGGAGGSRLNLLTDGSFEDGVSEGTCSGCTASQESSVILATPNNEKALKLAFAASTGCYTVDKTTGANFANVQGLVGAWIKNSSAGVTLTTRRNGADTLNVKSIDANGYYTYYEIPDVTGSTSFGYKVCATSSITGNIFVDETFAGPAKVTGTSNKIQTQSIAKTFAVVLTPTSDLSAGTSYNSSGSGVYTLGNTGIIFQKTATVIVNLTGNTSSGTLAYAYILLNGVYLPADILRMSSTSGASTSSFVFTASVGDILTFETGSTSSVFSVHATATEHFNTLSSTNGNTSWASCGHTTSDFTGFGTVTNIETQCKRDGDDLVMSGKFTSGTPTAVEARLNLKHQGMALTSSGTGKIPSLKLSGSMGRNAASTTYFGNGTLMEPSVGYITFSQQSSVENIITKRLGSDVVQVGAIVVFNARIPIAGWENSNVIVASLKDTPKTIGTSGSDIQSVYFGTGATCGTACSTGTCTICSQVGNKITSVSWEAAGTYRLNGLNGVKYNCSGTGVATTYAAIIHDKTTSTASYARLLLMNSAAALTNSFDNSVTCIGIP